MNLNQVRKILDVSDFTFSLSAVSIPDFSRTCPGNWDPYWVDPEFAKGDLPRPIHTLEGVADRVRSVSFAEIQARESFKWAAETFKDASPELISDWQRLSIEEDKHFSWLIHRLYELGHEVHQRRVTLRLWNSFKECKTARQFAHYIASSEDRGRIAGERFYTDLKKQDPKTAEIFGQIAFEEVSHVALATKHYPDMDFRKPFGT